MTIPKYILIAILAGSCSIASAQTKKQKPVVEQEPAAIDPPAPGEVAHQPATPPSPPEIFMYVEEMPSFPGNSLASYMAHNTHYPKEAEKEGIEGRAYVKMIIRKDGSVGQAEIVRSTGNELLDAEALRVVRAMPKWKPGRQNGQFVNVYYTLPVVFRLQ